MRPCSRANCKHHIQTGDTFYRFTNPKTKEVRDLCDGCGRSRIRMTKDLYGENPQLKKVREP